MSTYISTMPPVMTRNIEHEVRVCGTAETFVSETGILHICKGTVIPGGLWKIGLDSVVEISQEGSNVIMMCHDVGEYGIGKTLEEALIDLLTSFVDYRASLEKREGKLGAKEQSDLAQLRLLLER